MSTRVIGTYWIILRTNLVFHSTITKFKYCGLSICLYAWLTLQTKYEDDMSQWPSLRIMFIINL